MDPPLPSALFPWLHPYPLPSSPGSTLALCPLPLAPPLPSGLRPGSAQLSPDLCPWIRPYPLTSVPGSAPALTSAVAALDGGAVLAFPVDARRWEAGGAAPQADVLHLLDNHILTAADVVDLRRHWAEVRLGQAGGYWLCQVRSGDRSYFTVGYAWSG